AGRRELAAGQPASAADHLRAALALWRGQAYAEFDAPFATAERTALEELRLTALEDRVAAELTLGAGPGLVGELEALVGRHPWRERLWAQLMTALYRSGRQAEALSAFRRARAALVEELGVEPGPELRAVEAQVLAQDPLLLAAERAADRVVEGLPPGLAAVGPTFVGRQAELAGLVEAYERAVAGAVERVLVTGRHGMGKTRLLAELAREVQARGGLVRDGSSATWPGHDGVPLALLLDDLQRASTAELADLAERVVAARPPLLVVGTCVWEGLTSGQTAALSGMFRDRLEVPPLQPLEVAQVVALYVPPEATEDALDAVTTAGGVPLQVHAAASRYGETLAAAQVEEAAAGISAPRRRLSASQERIAGGVLDLQRIRLLRAAHDPVDTPRVLCPYKGLAFFDVDDAPYFFGRERLVARLVARLVDARLLAVVGASGSGKSSVVRAGLVAAIREGMLPGSQRWSVVVTTPTQPVPDLHVANEGPRTVLVVDQFEEVFTALTPSQRAGYADWLDSVAADDTTSVVVTVRSDYYPQAAGYRSISELLAANTVLVGEMAPDELLQAIELPAAAAGLELEPGLADVVASDVAGEPGGLPLMSTALLSVWERREGRRMTLAAYHQIGGVRAAVSRLAETAYQQLTESQQVVARRTLLRLADPGEGGDPVRRRVPIAEVAPDGATDAQTVLDTLATRRLLTVSDTHVEVAHEAVLREWPRLRGWLDDDEAGRQLRRHLAPVAADWQSRGRDPAELYRGPRLAAALDWQHEHPEDLTELEHEFLRASQHATEADAARRRRSIRRLRGLAVGLVAVLALAIAAGVLAVNQRNRADVRALQAAALSENRWDSALLLAAQAQSFDPSAESRAALLQAVQRGPEVTAMYPAGEALHSLAVSADGRRLVAGGSDGAVYVWDTETREVQGIPGVTGFENDQIDISPDGRYVAALSVPPEDLAQGALSWQTAVVDLEQTPPQLRYLGHTTRGGPRFAADGRTIVDFHGDGRVDYLDVETGDVGLTYDLEQSGDDSSFNAVSGPANRRFAVAADRDGGTVSAWEVGTGRLVWSATEEDELEAAISPDGARLALGYADGSIELIDVRTRASTPIPASLTEGLIDVEWAPDGSTFAGAAQDRTVLVWDADTLEVDAVLRGHWGRLSQLAYSPDGRTIYAAGLDQTVLAWDLTGDRGVVTAVDGTRPTVEVDTEALAADGSLLAIGFEEDQGGRVEVIEIPGAESFRVTVPQWPLNGWALTAEPQGRSVALVLKEYSGDVRHRSMWVHTVDVQRRELRPRPRIELRYRTGGDAVFTWDNEAVLAAGYSPDGLPRAGLWGLDEDAPPDPDLYEPSAQVGSVGVDPERRVAAFSEPRQVEIFDLSSGALVKTLVHGEILPAAVVFSPDGRWLVAGTGSGRVSVWDTGTWEQHTSWEAVPGFVVDSMVFTPDSDFLVTGGAGKAAIWDVHEGAKGGVQLEVDPSRRDARVLVGVRDDGTLVTFSTGTGVLEWDIAPERLLEHACTLVGRNLTKQEWADVLPDRGYERTCPQHPAGL
ncbi:MAG TPA: BTAD domain-containing putative transcriptional regulator, partial [Jiangellales bacterium]|nr:BTAD domain-containing putative transcriptional regulator [Jiangellales bacterium]